MTTEYYTKWLIISQAGMERYCLKHSCESLPSGYSFCNVLVYNYKPTGQIYYLELRFGILVLLVSTKNVTQQRPDGIPLTRRQA